jgi:hypothetical protein
VGLEQELRLLPLDPGLQARERFVERGEREVDIRFAIAVEVQYIRRGALATPRLSISRWSS